MSFKSNISKILTSSILLKVIFILSFFNLIGYLVYGDYHAIIFFFLVAGLVKYFSRNMILILGVPLFVVNLFVLGKSTKEGMENSKSSNNDDTSKHNNQSQDSTQDASGNTLKDTVQKINDKASTQQGLPITPIDDNTSNNTTNKLGEESFEVGRNKKGKYDIDYASTIEDAYDELNKIIGGDGIKKLTGDTQNLMKQQMQLAEAMKGMGPLIEQMGPLMQSVGPMIEQAKGMMGSGSNSIADLSKNFTAGAKKQ
jgi:hypothetical protein